MMDDGRLMADWQAPVVSQHWMTDDCLSLFSTGWTHRMVHEYMLITQRDLV